MRRHNSLFDCPKELSTRRDVMLHQLKRNPFKLNERYFDLFIKFAIAHDVDGVVALLGTKLLPFDARSSVNVLQPHAPASKDCYVVSAGKTVLQILMMIERRKTSDCSLDSSETLIFMMMAILSYGADVNALSTSGDTALDLALYNPMAGERIKYLLQRGAHINTSRSNLTSLHHAVRSGHEGYFDMLAKHFSDVLSLKILKTDFKGRTILSSTCFTLCGVDGDTLRESDGNALSRYYIQSREQPILVPFRNVDLSLCHKILLTPGFNPFYDVWFQNFKLLRLLKADIELYELHAIQWLLKTADPSAMSRFSLSGAEMVKIFERYSSMAKDARKLLYVLSECRLHTRKNRLEEDNSALIALMEKYHSDPDSRPPETVEKFIQSLESLGEIKPPSDIELEALKVLLLNRNGLFGNVAVDLPEGDVSEGRAAEEGGEKMCQETQHPLPNKRSPG